MFIGNMDTSYNEFFINQDADITAYVGMGINGCMHANRISYHFQFTGNSININCACASSLIAIHQAKCALQNEECDYAIVGSINLALTPTKNLTYSKARILSPTGRCKAFDKDADGFTPGEGVGVILLQKLNGAIEDKCHTYGIIKGSATNHVGPSKSITAPRVDSQKELILEAYRDAGISPEIVGYVEAHGTGTALGDPIEIEALSRAFEKYTLPNDGDGPLTATCSGFGWGGSNAHVILQEAPDTSYEFNDKFQILCVSARSETSFSLMQKEWKNYINTSQFTDHPASVICANTAIGRETFEYRAAAVVHNHEDIRRFISEIESYVPAKAITPKPAFVAGNYNNSDIKIDMLRESYRLSKIIDSITDSYNIALSELEEDDTFPLTQFLNAYIVSMCLMELGLRPQMVASLNGGALLAMCISKMISFEDAIRYLANKEAVGLIQVKRPCYPVLSNIDGAYIMPLEISEVDVNDFVNEMYVSQEQVTYYVDKCKKLFNHHSFIKTIQQWDAALDKYNINTRDFVEQYSESVPIDDRLKALLLVAIGSSIFKVNKKWDLRVHDIGLRPQINDAMLLIADGFITPNTYTEAIMSQKDLGMICDAINSNFHTVIDGDYSFLRQIDRNIVDYSFSDFLQMIDATDIERIKYDYRESLICSPSWILRSSIFTVCSDSVDFALASSYSLFS